MRRLGFLIFSCLWLVPLSCGREVETTTTTTEVSATSQSFGATVAGAFGAISSTNTALSLYRIKAASLTACDILEENTDDSISMDEDGTDGSYGNSGNSLVVTDGSSVQFCHDGGDVAHWTISTAISMSCTDSSDDSTVSPTMTGEGVFRETASAVQIYGTFTITIDSTSETARCSLEIPHDGSTVSFGDEDCEIDGAGVAQSSTLSCTIANDSGNEEEEEGDDGGSSNIGSVCTSDADCTGGAFCASLPGTKRCTINCTSDSDCSAGTCQSNVPGISGSICGMSL